MWQEKYFEKPWSVSFLINLIFFFFYLLERQIVEEMILIVIIFIFAQQKCKYDKDSWRIRIGRKKL